MKEVLKLRTVLLLESYLSRNKNLSKKSASELVNSNVVLYELTRFSFYLAVTRKKNVSCVSRMCLLCEQQTPYLYNM